MLVEQTYKIGDTVTLYLQTGQEVLGKLVSEDESNTVVCQPLTIAIGPKGAAFQTFTVSGDSANNVALKTSKIIAVLKTNDDTADSYRTATTGLVVPAQGKLVV